MREASVGFQCPECVKEGARTTRQATATYGGARSGDPRQTTIALIVANVAVFLTLAATGGSGSFLYRYFVLLPVDRPVGMSDGSVQVWQGVDGGAWWLLLTSAFSQTAILHIVLNMVTLWFVGPGLEARLGRARFLAVYLVSALTAGAGVYWLSSPYSVSLGASGAIFGVLGGLIVVSRKAGYDVRQLLVWVVLILVYPFFLRGANISWQGHLGGLIGGVLATLAIAYAPSGKRRSTLQWAAMAGIVLVTLALVALRSALL